MRSEMTGLLGGIWKGEDRRQRWRSEGWRRLRRMGRKRRIGQRKTESPNVAPNMVG